MNTQVHPESNNPSSIQDPQGLRTVSRPLFILTAALIMGVVAAPVTARLTLYLYILLSLTMILNILLYVKKRRTLIAPLCLFLLLGLIMGRPLSNLRHEPGLSLVSTQGGPVSSIGYLDAYPVRVGRVTRLTVNLTQQSGPGGWHPASGKIRINVENLDRNFHAGERVAILIRLKKPNNFNNPGNFNFEGYLARKGVIATAGAKDAQYIVSLGGENRLGWFGLLLHWRQELAGLIQQTLPPPESNLMQALLLGEKTTIPIHVKELFHRTGVGHLLAISGLHMGIVALGVYTLLLSLFKRCPWLAMRTNVFKSALIGSLPPLIFYTLISGLSLSAMRASIMILAFILAFLADRYGDNISKAALAALVVLAVDPTAPRHVSFQLSFVAVLAIIYVGERFLGRRTADTHTMWTGIMRKGYAWLTITFTAYIVTLPLVAHHFNRISVVGILTNVWAVPLVGFWVVPVGLTSAFLFLVYPSIAALGLKIAAWPLSFVLKGLAWFDSLSYSSFYIFTLNWLEVCIYLAFFFLLLELRRFPYARLLLALTLTVGVLDAAYWVHERWGGRELKVTFLDVHQGNAALVLFPGGNTMMVDGGGFYRSDYDVGRWVVAPYLWSKKIIKLDYIVCTHPHPDHVNGLVFLADRFRPKQIWSTGEENHESRYADLMEVAERKRIPHKVPMNLQEKLVIGGVEVKVLYPPVDFLARKVREPFRTFNNNSLVIQLTNGHNRFLLPADLEKEGERELMSMVEDLHSDVLLSPHHGSTSSSTLAFIKAVNPRIIVISAGKDNWWGLPHRAVLKRYRALGSDVYRTDLHGAVTVSSDGSKVRVQTYIKPNQ